VPIPDVTRNQIIEALQHFDKQKPESDSWHGWACAISGNWLT